MIRALFGLEPDKFSTNKLNINAGHVAEFYGSELYAFPTQTQVDLATSGLWGLDTGSPVDGMAVYLYVVAKSPGDYGIVASRERFAGGVAYPPGYVFKRKLPWGVMYHSAWDGIPNFHLTHWPMPSLRFSDAEYTTGGGLGNWSCLWAGTAPGFTDVNVAPWIPDNARLGYFLFECRYSGGTAGSAYVRSHGGQQNGLLVGSVSPASAFTFSPMTLRVTSDRKFQYKVTGTGCGLNVYVLGYSMTEPA